MSKHEDSAFKALHEHYLCHYTVSECFGGIPASKKTPTHTSQGIYLFMRSKSGDEKVQQRIFGQCVRHNIIEWFQEDGTTYIKLHSDILKHSKCENPVKAIVAKHAGLPINQL